MVLLKAKMEVLTIEEVTHFYVGEQNLDNCDNGQLVDLCMAEGEASNWAVQGQPLLVWFFLTLPAILVKASRQ